MQLFQLHCKTNDVKETVMRQQSTVVYSEIILQFITVKMKYSIIHFFYLR